MSELNAHTIAALDGSPLDLSAFAGKPLLIVNVASKCGLTPQYEGLEALHKTYADLTVLGVPCNQFGGQEPGSPDEIKQFCTTNYGVSFPMTEKVDVNGANRHPLYAWLTAAAVGPEPAGDISWNFTKFLLGRDGGIRARFAPATTPEAAELREAIEAALSSE